MPRTSHRAFTLVEILVVLAIIGMLTAVIFPSLLESRKKGRDTARIADIEQLSVALRLYAEQNGAYPSYSAGTLVGEGGAFDDDLATFIDVSHDLSGPGDADRYYFYDSSYDCPLAGGDSIVLFANTMEREENGNWSIVCDSDGPATRYGVILN